MKRLALFVAALASAATASPAAAWGPIGHRVAGDLAERNMDGHTRAQVKLVLGEETLAEASTWPDEERSNPAPFWQETASPWHYVTLPDGRTIDVLDHPAEGDAATALDMFTATLRNPASSQEEKALALRFIVHIVADLHMPLHVGNGTDRGGNDFFVNWFDQQTNLHWVWDEGMILRQQLSFSEYADRLARRTTPADTIAWWDARPETWMQESADLRQRIYPRTSEEFGIGTEKSPAMLKYQYNYDWTPTMERRLQQAGVRTAAYLDWVFASKG